MFRLRTTISLSLLALAVGVAGTAWLSSLTGDWQGPAGKVSARRDAVRTVLRRHARTPPPAQPAVAAATVHTPAAPTHVAPELPTLTPIEMPALPTSWLQRTAFVDGRVVLRLGIDGEGRVDQAAVAESSGNAALDERALRTVARWRFAVPGDHPGGLTGALVMRFDATPPNASL
ncbi:energy transducer TonB [Dyella kyungheensis]|uniref:energy transducer TonB n=1 Tax=Dyella kyungheensis TaxID=1242174 RepID=UPI003CFB85E2